MSFQKYMCHSTNAFVSQQNAGCHNIYLWDYSYILILKYSVCEEVQTILSINNQ